MNGGTIYAPIVSALFISNILIYIVFYQVFSLGKNASLGVVGGHKTSTYCR